MTTYQKSVAEKIGIKEKTLQGSRTYSGGKEITRIALSSIWDTLSAVSTTWDEAISIQKDE